MKLIKEIKSRAGQLHFRRWAIWQTKYFSCYLHGIYQADEDVHLHNHPWSLFTIVLRGSYQEELADRVVHRGFLHLGFRSRTQYHKIQKIFTPVVYTLAFTFGARQEWGYQVEGQHVPHQTYRQLKQTK